MLSFAARYNKSYPVNDRRKEQFMDVMERQKLTEDQIEKLAVEIREFLLE